jgi:transposase
MGAVTPIAPAKCAYARFLFAQGWSIRRVAKETKMSKSAAHRLKHTDLEDYNPRLKNKGGRKEILSIRDKRHILRCLQQLRQDEGFFTAERLMKVSGISKERISIWTFRRFLNNEGYFYYNARQKGILSPEDRQNRVRYCKKIKRDFPGSVWTDDIAFYLDGVNFVYKTKPKDQTYAPTKRVWRRKTEGLKQGCIAKGKKEGTGRTVVRLIVAIAYRKGVIICEEYEKLNGAYFADFINRNFIDMFGAADKDNARYFVQDGDPSQNSRIAKEAMAKAKAEIFEIPCRSPDLNPIENIFHLTGKSLRETGKTIDYESRDEFVQRIRHALHSIPVETIDRTISSMAKRIDLVIQAKGERVKY